MSSQRLFQILLFIVIAAAGAAIWIWRTSGEPPPAWLNHVILATALAAVAVFLISDALRPRLMLRFLASLFALIGVIAFAADLTQGGGTGAMKATSFLGHFNDFAPTLLASVKASFARSPVPFVWDPVLTTLLSYPTSVIFAVLALVTGLASRPRREVRIFVN